MTRPFTHVHDSATITNARYYLISDSTTAVYQTTAALVSGWIDFSAMTAAETYDVEVWEKVNGSAAKLVFINRLVGVQSDLYRFDLGPVKEGYEISVIKVAGTDRSIGWGINTDLGDVNVTEWLGTAPATPTTAGVPRVDVKAMEANVLTATAINADAITAAKIADGAIDRATLAQDVKDMLGEIHRGTAQAGTATTITLAAGAAAVNDAFKDAIISCVGGTGAGQFNSIGGYVGSTRVATVLKPWTHATPDATTVYETYVTGGAVDEESVAVALWDALMADHVEPDSFGEAMQNVNAPLSDIVSAIAALPALVADAVGAFAHIPGRTLKGAIARMDQLITGAHNGMLAAIWQLMGPDGVTPWVEAAQNVAAGTRDAATTILGE